MGIVRGINVTNEDLLYGYDTGFSPVITNLESQSHHNDYRFYRGIPATNVISSGIPGYFGSGGTTLYQKTLNGFSSASGVFQRNFVNNPAQANTGTYNNNAGLFHSGLSFTSLSASTEYIMISFDFYMVTPYVRHSSSGTGLNGYLGVTYTDGSGGNHGWNDSLAGGAGDDWNNNSAYVGKWRKIALIADLTDSKTPSSINAMYIYNDRTIQGEGIFTNFVITEHSTLPTAPAQWIPQAGARAQIECLIDLKRTTDISVANMSFDSTGQPVFDGSDDILNTGKYSGRNPSASPFTIEAIVKSDTTSGNHMWVDASGNGNNQRLYCAHAATGTNTPLGIQNSGWSHSIPSDTDYHHYVITMDGNKATLYNNSVLHSTKTYTSYTLSGQINVGGRSGYRWNGDIPVFKIYSRVLQTSDITRNYNAYKKRFNL